MNIEDYKWSDNELFFIDCDPDAIKLEALGYSDRHGGDCRIIIRKQDAIAIAKHFNVDNESLVEGIKELIGTTRNKDAEVFSANDLQKLITKEE